MKRWWAELRLACSFLTILPIGSASAPEARLLGRSMAWFPLVGLLLGLLLAGAECGLGLAFPPGVSAALTLLLLIVLTGALHLDGVADTADGLYGLRDRDSRLRIMKDSRVGAIGAVALGSLLLLKFAALTGIPPERRWAALLVMPMAGRWMMTTLAVCSPYARPEGGTGGAFVDQAGRRELLLGTLLLVAALLPLYGAAGVALLGGLALFALATRSYFFAKLGGITGDLLGASCEWSEALILLCLSATIFN